MRNFSSLILTAIFLVGCVQQKEDYSKFYLTFPENFTLHLEIDGNQDDTVEVELIVNPHISLEKEKRTQNIFIVNNKKETLEVYIDRPSKGHLYIEDEQFTIAIKPNTESSITYNTQKKEITFQNEDNEISDINHYYLRKKKFLGYPDIRRPYNHMLNNASTFESINSFVDSLTKVELNFLNKETSSNSLPKWFIDYENAEIFYQNLSIKTELPLINEVFRSLNYQHA